MSENNKVLLQGDCLDMLKELPDNSIDSLVTDPPAGISFMGKAWDDDKGGRKQWIAWMTEVMQECLRVLKPGAHGLVWAIPRTSHWTATALEDAGFEVRDVVTHLFGSGFPKSLNVGKQTSLPEHQGIGTALKPASEHWILVRKPLSEKTVAANVLEHGTGGINIDASRVGPADPDLNRKSRANKLTQSLTQVQMTTENSISNTVQGRFPANLVLSHNDDCVEVCTPGCAVAELDKQSGILSAGHYANKTIGFDKREYHGKGRKTDSGGASRFFYVAKASKRDKNSGLPQGQQSTHPTVKSSTLMSYLIKLITPHNGLVLDPFMGSGSTGVAALKEGFSFIGIEKEPEYYEIADKRTG